VLTVTGSAVNNSDEARPTPELRVTLKDEGGKEVQTWTDKLAVTELKPGERTEFTSRFEAPPVETYRLTVTFAYPDGETGGGETQIEATPASAPEPEPTQAVAHTDEAKAPAADHAPEPAHVAPAVTEAGHN
jgi:hypothetical protein